MKHTALIITAGSDSGARFGVPFLLPALRAACACCEDVREIREEEVDSLLEEEGMTLILDASMPLVTEEDCRLLLESVEDGAAVASAKGTKKEFPRCQSSEGRKEKEVALSDDALFIVRDAEDLAEALKILRHRKNLALMREGVILLDPKKTYIDPDVRIGTGTVVHPGNTLTGGTVVGERCMLLPGSRLHKAVIGDEVTIENSVLTECAVGNRTTVGPFAYLRPGAEIGEGCRVGDFVEIKNSVIGDETKISHLTYVGDADLGKNINLGCGVVFVNYDGKHKHRTTVEDDAFIGCNTNLVSPVRVGSGAYVAAATTVTEDVPAGAFAIGRSRQTVKEGWVEQRKTEGKL